MSARDSTQARGQAQMTNVLYKFDIHEYKPSGKDVGILMFDLVCKDTMDPKNLVVHFSSDFTVGLNRGAAGISLNAHNGLQVAPTDSSPRWLKSNILESIEIAITDPAQCSQTSLRNTWLYQRSYIERTE